MNRPGSQPPLHGRVWVAVGISRLTHPESGNFRSDQPGWVQPGWVQPRSIQPRWGGPGCEESRG